MNIFSNLRVYAGKWALKASRVFNQEELAGISSARVVASQYGNSVCFMMVSGGQTFIPLDQSSTLGVGEAVDLSNQSSSLSLKREKLTFTVLGLNSLDSAINSYFY